jgi:uncharacterized membrane protein YdbT with pleckstrin-like domain
LPALGGHEPTSFQPAKGFLRYLIIQFWLGAGFLVLLEFSGVIGIAFGSWQAGLIAALVAIPLALVIVAVAYMAIYLRYDTTWYVISDRSLRIRRGIWVIHETTITFENVQNVGVHQGPLQRFCGIANVLVETAGGGGKAAAAHGGKGGQAAASHQGLIEGVADAERIRDLLLSRLRQSKSAGLGDEHEEDKLPVEKRASHVGAWSPAHLAALREIRDEAAALAGTTTG